MKTISVLGSTGSVGTQTLDVIRNNSDMKIQALSAGSNIIKLEEQIREFKPLMACVMDKEKSKELAVKVQDLPVKIVSGMEGLLQIAADLSADILVTAIVGMIGIRPTIAAIESGKVIALANKETLVCAGHLIMPLIKQKKSHILPVDSEHCAIFQALNGENKKEVKSIILTASGGPFRGKNLEQLKNITPKEALKHPNWSMGPKITIDSSTLVNKGLEVMEAKWLFDVKMEQIQVVVHPQSVVHSMVEYIDGSVIAQLGVPDMKGPIQYALTYPRRRNAPIESLDFASLKQLTFENADMDTFKGLALAYEAGTKAGSLPVVYNAANEWAVARFLREEIRYLCIAKAIEAAMEAHELIENPNVDEILETEAMTYRWLDNWVKTDGLALQS